MTTSMVFFSAVSICPTREITLTQGEVTSPNYPSNYPSNADCSLTIDGGRGARFTVKFDSFEVEEDEDGMFFDLCVLLKGIFSGT